jgi:hypothetical protein
MAFGALTIEVDPGSKSRCCAQSPGSDFFGLALAVLMIGFLQMNLGRRNPIGVATPCHLRQRRALARLLRKISLHIIII